jgi:FkbM family methyltransferase
MTFLENFIRSNFYLYVISRSLYNFFFNFFFYEDECEVFKYLKKKSNITIIDVGSSDLSFSSYISKFFYKSNFFCFEPSFHLYKNKKLKNDNKLYIFNKACSNKSKKLVLFTPFKKILTVKIYLKYFTSYSLKFIKKNLIKYFNCDKNIFFEKILVNTIKIDNLNLKPDLIKLDVEGHEINVILGAIKTIKKIRPIIYIENPSKVVDKLFYSLNYRKFQYKKKIKKLFIVKKNNKSSYNYLYIYNKDFFYQNIYE